MLAARSQPASRAQCNEALAAVQAALGALTKGGGHVRVAGPSGKVPTVESPALAAGACNQPQPTATATKPGKAAAARPNHLTTRPNGAVACNQPQPTATAAGGPRMSAEYLAGRETREAETAALLVEQHTKALELIVRGHSIPVVAELLFVHRVTVWRWTVAASFAAELAEVRRERRAVMRERLDIEAEYALGVLSDILHRRAEATTGERLRAAAVVLSAHRAWAPLAR